MTQQENYTIDDAAAVESPSDRQPGISSASGSVERGGRGSGKSSQKARHSSSSAREPPSPSRSTRRNKERNNSSKAKEKSRRASDRPATVPGAVSSSSNKRTEKKKDRSSSNKRASSNTSATKSGDRKSRSSSSLASKPGAVPSTGRESRKGSSRSNKSDHRPSKASSSSRSSTNRGSRPISEEKRNAEAVDDSEMETTTNALREKNRENEALRQELQRTKEDQASQSRRRCKIPLWVKLCFGCLLLIAGAVVAVLLLSGDDGANGGATPSIVNATYGVFQPPSASTCSKISEGRPVDGQEEMSRHPLSVTLSVHIDIDSEPRLLEILQELLQNVQLLVMPPVAGCGNTTLDLYHVGNAQVDQGNVVLGSCEEEMNGPCYTVQFPVNLFIKKEAETYIPEELGNRVGGIFENSTSLLLNAQDENSKAIKDIRSVASVPVTPSPSTQPSIQPVVVTDTPSATASSKPTLSLTVSPTQHLTAVPTGTPGVTAPPATSTPGPSVAPVTGPTLAPTLIPSLGPSVSPTTGAPTLAPVPGLTPVPTPLPTPGPTVSPSRLSTPTPTIASSFGPSDTPSRATSSPPTNGPTIAPTIGPSGSPSRAPSTTPTLQTSSAPTTKCTRLAMALSRFAPLDGDKAQALAWLCSDTWEPPLDATDETGLWEERFALAVFYYATNGAGWINNDGWLTAASVCSWTGVDGCNVDGSVTVFSHFF